MIAATVWLGLHDTGVERAVAVEPSSPSAAAVPPSVTLEMPPVESPSASRADTMPAIAPETSADPTAPAESAGTRLFGFVRPAKGRAVLVDGAAYLIDRLGEQQLAHCGTDGGYSFSGLAPGRYTLGSRSPHNGAAHAEVELDARTPEKRVDLQLVLSTEVTVKSTDRAGQPIKIHRAGGFVRLQAVATDEPPPEWLADFSGDASESYGAGSFRPIWRTHSGDPEEELGTLLLDHEPPVYASVVLSDHVLATQRVEPGQTEVRFVLDADADALQLGSLRVRFVDAESRTVVDVHMMMLNGSHMLTAPRKGDAFFVEQLIPGAYRVRPMARGYEGLDLGVRVEPGKDTDLGDVALERERWITGTVLDPEGRACEIQLTWNDFDPRTGEAPVLEAMLAVKSRADGSFRIPGLSRRSYVVRTLNTERSAWAEWSRVIDMSAGPLENLRIQLERGVPLVVRPSDPQSWNAVRFRILDETGFAVQRRRLSRLDPHRVLLAPGSYTVEVDTAEGSEPKRIAIQIAAEPVLLAIP